MNITLPKWRGVILFLMKYAWLAIVVLAAVALDAQASGGRVAAHAGAHIGSPHPAHGPAYGHPGHIYPSHGHGTVVFGAAFVGLGYWPGYYYPPPVYYAPPPPPVSYWYYCAPLGAYYPYVPSCPGPWQPVPASPYNY